MGVEWNRGEASAAMAMANDRSWDWRRKKETKKLQGDVCKGLHGDEGFVFTALSPCTNFNRFLGINRC